MIAEHALLHIRAGERDAFVAAIRSAGELISASPGFKGIEVLPASGNPQLFLLLVRWDDIASHRDGFRESPRYEKWRAALHHYYAPMPQIRYFEESIL